MSRLILIRERELESRDIFMGRVDDLLVVWKPRVDLLSMGLEVNF
jgi:hypothetical protein